MSDALPRSSQNRLLVGRLCFEIAYQAIPQTIFGPIPDDDLKRCLTFSKWGVFFYLQHCKVCGIEPDLDVVDQFQSHLGLLDEKWNYMIIEYPTPPSTPDDFMMLFPYYSAILQRVDDPRSLQYYVMAQTLRGTGTTIRTVTPNGTQASSGSGPEPSVQAFLEAIRIRLTRDKD